MSENSETVLSLIARATELNKLPEDKWSSTPPNLTDDQKALACNLAIKGTTLAVSQQVDGSVFDLSTVTMKHNPWFNWYLLRTADKIRNPESPVSAWFIRNCVKPCIENPRWNDQASEGLIKAWHNELHADGLARAIIPDIENHINVPVPALSHFLCADIVLSAAGEAGKQKGIDVPLPVRGISQKVLGVFSEESAHCASFSKATQLIATALEDPKSTMSRFYALYRQEMNRP
jgi:hypothetical protein